MFLSQCPTSRKRTSNEAYEPDPRRRKDVGRSGVNVAVDNKTLSDDYNNNEEVMKRILNQSAKWNDICAPAM